YITPLFFLNICPQYFDYFTEQKKKGIHRSGHPSIQENDLPRLSHNNLPNRVNFNTSFRKLVKFTNMVHVNIPNKADGEFLSSPFQCQKHRNELFRPFFQHPFILDNENEHNFPTIEIVQIQVRVSKP